MSRVYFTDRDLGKRFPEILAAAGLAVERHHDHFPPDGPDEQWLEYCGTGNRIAITHNERIRYTPNELAAVERFCVALLVVVGKASFPALAQNFVRTLPRIEVFLDAQKPPFIAKVYRPSPTELVRNSDAPGSISPWYPQTKR